MRRGHFELFRPVCPICARSGRAAGALVLAAVAEERGDEVVAGILHCPDPACWREYPIIDGIPLIVPELQRLLNEQGAGLLLRDDLDPLIESLVGDALGPGSWLDTVRQIQSTYGWDAYADLDPEEPPPDGPVPGAARRCLDRLETLAPGGEARRILDLGCAAGRTTLTLAERHPDAAVLGIDLDLAVLRLARNAAAGQVSYPRRRIGVVFDRRRFPVAFAGAGRVDFWACDALALPFAAGTIDRVVALNLLDCVPEPQRLLAGLGQVLRPRGRLLLATPYDWSTRATPVGSWIGGHSQRADHRGAAEGFLRALLTEGAHPQSVPGLEILGEDAGWPWQTRLHDRSSVQYRTHLMAVGKRSSIT
ncbi:MAG TPA: methyltransferase domain-containing protein [Stellaceae bacterium]|nr:methyltransferase domain-containing protein [Stellaceae bacterium]